MASTIQSVDVSIAKLATTFQTAIKATIEAESTPLKKAQTLKDDLVVRSSIYTDIKANFDGLQSAVQALISTQASFGLSMTRKATVSPTTTGTTVLSATNTDSAAVGEYDITVGLLAKSNIKSTSGVSSADVALNKSGDFWLGGDGTGLAALQTETTPGEYGTFAGGNSVTGAVESTVATGKRELGTGDYTMQVRDYNGMRQFRMVNADGDAVSVRSQSGSSYTSAWQSMTSGTYDTGRGQTLTLSTDGSAESSTFHYTAAGKKISIAVTDSLRTIAAAINAATQPEGRDFKASIVSNQLVLSGAQTGVNHSLLYSDGVGLGLDTVLSSARNATFKVNGMDITKAGNSNLSDVIEGVTLNLASDAENKTARLSIGANSDKAVGLMNTLVSKFNTALTHLQGKLTSTSSVGADGKTKYTHGPLSGDTVFNSLRTDIFARMSPSRVYSNSGSLSRLSEIGLSFDKDMKLTFDSAIFSAAITNSPTDVTALMDAGMGDVNSLLARYSGSSGALSKTLTSITDQKTSYEKRITKYNDALAVRKQALYTQYLGYQNQLAEYGRTQQLFDAFYGTTSTTSISG